MCGIAGFAGNFDPGLLTTMNAAIAHRGPDDEDTLLLDAGTTRVGLAHRRLSIIDLSSGGRQPMAVECEQCGPRSGLSPNDRMWLLYNGELYNYRELRTELSVKGHHFHSGTDSEVLLHLYAEEGPDMLRRLNGIFAIALYDGRPTGQQGGMTPGSLLVARDGIGVKPLYYAETANGLLFASELKAIAACDGVDRNLDLIALHYYFAYLWCPGQRTPLTGVKKCTPGEAMIVRDGRIDKRWSFYDLPYGQPWLTGSEDEIAAELRSRLMTAVDRQLVADVPVGAFLSGGLDSSAIVAMMRKLRPDDRIQCYSIGFAGADTVEGNPADLPYASRVAKHLGVDLHVLEVKPDMINQLERMLYHLDEPQADPAPINAMLISQQARADGIKVLMSGAGGDDIFSGYRRHVALRMERMWSWLPQSARSGMAAVAGRVADGEGGSGLTRYPLGRRLSKLFAHADLDGDARLAAYFYWNGDALRRSLYSRDMKAATIGLNTAEPLLESLRRIPNERDPLNRMLYLEAKHFLADHNLNYTDKTSMAHGVEVRVPLLDLELVDFATRIPPHMKQKGRVGKAIFKKAMEPYLPQDVIYRPKSGFGAPLRRWLHQELRELVQDVLSPASLNRRGLFDPEQVWRLIDLDRQGRIDGAYTIFSMLCMELWCRMFVDGKAPATVQ